MNSNRFRHVAALLLCTSLTLDLAACSSGISTPTEQAGKPIANAGTNRDVKLGVEVQLDGSASKGASPSDTLTYHWTMAAPATSKSTLKGVDTVDPTFTPDVVGAYAITLVVRSGGVESDPFKVTLTATKDNAKPVATFAASPANPKTGDVIKLESTSSDADKDPLTFKWTLKAAAGSAAKLSDATSGKPTFTADKAGVYDVALIVNDGKIDSEPFGLAITVSDPAVAKPTAVAKSSKDAVAPGDSIDLDGSASKVEGAAKLTYLWSIKSKPTGSTVVFTDAQKILEKPTLKLDLEGTYEINLVVNDGKNDSDPASIKVTAKIVKPTAAIAPISSATVGTEVVLDGSASKPAKAGETLTYAWTIEGAPAEAKLVDADKVKSKFTATKKGIYKVLLVVSEGALKSDPQTLSVDVK